MYILYVYISIVKGYPCISGYHTAMYTYRSTLRYKGIPTCRGTSL